MTIPERNVVGTPRANLKPMVRTANRACALRGFRDGSQISGDCVDELDKLSGGEIVGDRDEELRGLLRYVLESSILQLLH
jgi:hypothetical protein